MNLSFEINNNQKGYEPIMKFILHFLLIIITLYSCKKEESAPGSLEVISLQKEKIDFDKDDFSDFKKKEGKCESEEEILKKQFKQNQKQAPTKLQGGGNIGCAAD